MGVPPSPWHRTASRWWAEEVKVDQLVTADTITCACARYGLTPQDPNEWSVVHRLMDEVAADMWIDSLLPWQHAYVVVSITGSDTIIFHAAAIGKKTAMKVLIEVMDRMGR